MYFCLNEIEKVKFILVCWAIDRSKIAYPPIANNFSYHLLASDASMSCIACKFRWVLPFQVNLYESDCVFLLTFILCNVGLSEM